MSYDLDELEHELENCATDDEYQDLAEQIIHPLIQELRLARKIVDRMRLIGIDDPEVGAYDAFVVNVHLRHLVGPDVPR